MAVSLVTFAFAFEASALSITYKDESNDPITSAAYDGVEDTSMIEASNDQRNQNFGARGNMFVHNRGGNRENILLRFDITSLAGQYSSINSATLRLFFSNSTGTDAGFIDAFELVTANGSWVEGPGNSSIASNNFPGTATWAERARGTQSSNGAPTGTAWASGVHNYSGLRNGGAGLAADHVGSAVASATVLGTEVAGNTLNFVISDLSLIADWANGTNTGLVLISRAPVGSTGGGGTFYSSEANVGNASDQQFHPELIIGFTAIPEPGTALLVMTGALGLAISRRRRT